MPPGKAGALVAWDKKLYIHECNLHLKDPNFYSNRRDNFSIFKKNKKKNPIDKNEKTKSTPKLRREPYPIKRPTYGVYSDLGKPSLCLILKIHKPNDPGSAGTCPTIRLLEFFDSRFLPVITELPSFIKDTEHAVSIFKSARLLPG